MLKLKSNAFGELGAGLASGATSISLKAGHGVRFPVLGAGDYFPAHLIRKNSGLIEEILVTARSTDTLTVARAKGGTTALEFFASDRIQIMITADAVARIQQEAAKGFAVTGTNNYVASWDPAPVGYVEGVTYRAKIANANTGASDINISSLGVIQIKKGVNQALSAGDMPAGGWSEMVYDGTNMQLLNPATSIWQPGDTKYCAFPDAQSGWLAFSNSPVSRATYAALAAKAIKTKTGTISSGVPEVTALASTSDLFVGQRAYGAGIPKDARILTIDSVNQVTLTRNATASTSGLSIQFHWWGIGDGSTTFHIPGPGRSPVAAGTATVVETFTQADIDAATDTITIESNKDVWFSGRQVTVGITGTAPTTSPANQLDNGDTAYVIRASDTTIKLASSRANALAETPVPIDITVVGSGTFTLTYSLTERVVGESGGEESHPQSHAELVAHAHGIGIANSLTGAGVSGNANATNSIFSTSRGGNEPMNIMGPHHVMHGFIKT